MGFLNRVLHKGSRVPVPSDGSQVEVPRSRVPCYGLGSRLLPMDLESWVPGERCQVKGPESGSYVWVRGPEFRVSGPIFPICLRNFIEIVLRYGCSPVNLLHIFRIPFLKNTSERLLLKVEEWSSKSRCYKIWHSKKYAVNLDQKKKRKILRNYEDTREKSKRRRLEDLDDLVFK